MNKRLPISIQTLRTLRERNAYYVDKTPFIWRMIDEGTRFFLSRPRRFGKSLLVDTLKCLFAGEQDLFEGTFIHDRWDWSARFPVVRLDFSNGSYGRPGLLEANLAEQLAAAERHAGIAGDACGTIPGRLANLLHGLHERTGQQAVVLVDEYDKPILDALEDAELAKANREFLAGVYGTLKFADAHIRFAFLTGVTKFIKVGMFSGPNNLVDITLDPPYSSICGYTDADLDAVFADELEGLDRQRMRDWYNGYNWLGAQTVYNPHDILLLLRSRRFDAHWFETGTPTFLIETLIRRGTSPLELERPLGRARLLSAFDIDDVDPPALLFQAGYLTIRGEEERAGRIRYRLGYPNREVCQSLNESLLAHLTRSRDRDGVADQLLDLLCGGDIDGIGALLRAFFAGIPHQWRLRGDLARYEGYYAAVFYACFAAAAGPAVAVEDSGSAGRADMTVRYGGAVYIFEFKVIEQAGAGAAMAQLRERGYADKYRALGQPIHLVAVEFSSARRNIAAFEHERA